VSVEKPHAREPEMEKPHKATCQTQRDGAYPHCTCLGDNHHNALTCPHCNPNGLVLVPADHVRERERLMAVAQRIGDQADERIARLLDKLSAAEARITTLSAALVEYGQHKPSCTLSCSREVALHEAATGETPICTCGFDLLSAASQKEQG
jgi:hypothetical protein